MKKLLSSILAATMLFTLTACGGSTAEATTIRAAVGGDVELLDPAIVDDSVTANVLAQMYEGLYKLDKDGNAQPSVATGPAEVSEDGLVYTIKLKEGITWSDGEPLTASDYVYAWKRATAMGTAAAYYSQFISENIVGAGDGSPVASMDDLADFGAVALDDTTIQITLIKPVDYFSSLLTNTVFYPVRQSAVEKDGGDPLTSLWADQLDVPTNGAFTATAINAKDEVVLTKSANYHSADEVKMETISFKVMADANSQTSAFQSGQLDFATSVNSDTINADENLQKDLYLIDPFVVNYYVLMNAGDENTVEALKDVEIRKAFGNAINRDEIVTATGKGELAYPLYNLVPVGIPGVDGDFTTESGNDYAPAYDVEAGKAIMESKGYSADNMLTLQYSYNDNSMHKDVAQVMQAQLKEVYIDLQLKAAELQTFFTARDAGEFETVRHAMTADFLDPYAYLSMYYGKAKAGNTVDDDHFEALIDTANALSGNERLEALKVAEQYLVEEQAYVIPLFGYTDPKLKAANLEGVTSSPEGHYDLTRAYFAEK